MEKCRIIRREICISSKLYAAGSATALFLSSTKGDVDANGSSQQLFFHLKRLHIFYKSKYKRWTFCHTLTSNIGKKCWRLLSVLRKHQMGAIQLVVPYGLGNIGGTSSCTLPSRLG